MDENVDPAERPPVVLGELDGEHRARSRRRGLLLVLGVALAVRLLFLFFVQPPPSAPPEGVWRWGCEQASVARSLLRGDGFSDAFMKGTGPTAWCGPVFPSLLAGLMRLFGTEGRALAVALALVHSLVSALIAPLLWRLGRNLGREDVGRLAAWGWAFHPYAVQAAVSLVWDSVLLSLALCAWMVLLTGVRITDPPRRLVPVGLALGALLLINPMPLTITPAALLFLKRGRSVRAWLVAALAMGLPALLVVSPWLVRNQRVLGTWNFKANLGTELMVGNMGEQDAGFDARLHPSWNGDELRRYRELGEVGYGRDCMRHFRDWLADHPGSFARACLQRVGTFWFGHSPFRPKPLRGAGSLRRDYQSWIKWWVFAGTGLLALLGALVHRDAAGGRVLLVGTVVLYPDLYYATHVLERYRYPIEPLLVLLAASALVRGWRRLVTTCRPM